MKYTREFCAGAASDLTLKSTALPPATGASSDGPPVYFTTAFCLNFLTFPSSQRKKVPVETTSSVGRQMTCSSLAQTVVRLWKRLT